MLTPKSLTFNHPENNLDGSFHVTAEGPLTLIATDECNVVAIEFTAEQIFQINRRVAVSADCTRDQWNNHFDGMRYELYLDDKYYDDIFGIESEEVEEGTAVYCSSVTFYLNGFYVNRSAITTIDGSTLLPHGKLQVAADMSQIAAEKENAMKSTIQITHLDDESLEVHLARPTTLYAYEENVLGIFLSDADVDFILSEINNLDDSETAERQFDDHLRDDNFFTMYIPQGPFDDSLGGFIIGRYIHQTMADVESLTFTLGIEGKRGELNALGPFMNNDEQADLALRRKNEALGPRQTCSAEPHNPVLDPTLEVNKELTAAQLLSYVASIADTGLFYLEEGVSTLEHLHEVITRLIRAASKEGSK